MLAQQIKIFVMVIAILNLAGCAAAALAPMAHAIGSMANGARENAVTVTIDEKSFSQGVRDQLLKARHIGFAATDPGAIRASDILETRGKYTVTIDRPTAKVGEMTGSERRTALAKICSSMKPDIAMLNRSVKTTSQHGLLSGLVGRAATKNEWMVEMLVCRDNQPLQFGGQIEYDIGLFNPKSPAEYEEMAGEEIATKILLALNR